MEYPKQDEGIKDKFLVYLVKNSPGMAKRLADACVYGIKSLAKVLKEMFDQILGRGNLD